MGAKKGFCPHLNYWGLVPGLPPESTPMSKGMSDGSDFVLGIEEKVPLNIYNEASSSYYHCCEQKNTNNQKRKDDELTTRKKIYKTLIEITIVNMQ